MIEEAIKHIEDRIRFSDLRPEIVIKKESAEAVLLELNKYKMISDRLAEKLELLIISIYHKEEILALNTNKVKEYYENNKSIKAELIRECKEELDCFLRERGRSRRINMFEYKPNKEEMEKKRKEFLKELEQEQENPKPRNRAERRAYERKNRKKHR